MLLAFRTQGLRSMCEDEAVARKRYEPEVVEQLQSRLADLNAANSVYDLVAGRLQFAPGGRSVSLSLTSDYELVFEVNHGVPPRDAQGTIDWAQVSRIKIMAIERDDVDA